MINRRELFRVSLISAGAAVAVPTTTFVPEVFASPALPTARPKLAGACTPAELAARSRALADARQMYRWSTTVPNVEGVPMVGKVPVGDNPSVDWLIEFVQGLLDLITNLVDTSIALVLPQLKDALVGFSLQVRNLKNRAFEVIDQVNVVIKKYATATIHTVVEAADKTVIDTAMSVFLTIISALQDIRRNLFVAVEKALQAQGIFIGDVGDPTNLRKYNVMWGSTPLPEPAKHLHDDSYFARARVGGAKPMIIERVRGTLPANLKLDKAKTEEVLGESLSGAISAGRLYVCDYEELGAMAKEDATFKLLTGTNYNTAPIAVFVRPAGEPDLRPVAIQVGQHPGTSPVFYPPVESGTARQKSQRYWGWEMAKTVVQTADFNHHEMFSHLSRTHLVSEAFCLSTKRTLPPGHPLRTLLDPHFEGDLFINNLAASIIMGPETFADIILAPNIAATQSTAGRARLKWDFERGMLANNISDRGMDDPELNYPYRDDATTIWKSIDSWVGEYLAVYYPSDEAVRTDAELKNWLKEAAGPGKVAGIPAVDSVASLRSVITMVIFTASAQHAAVNYPQRDEISYAPFAAGTIRALPKDPNHKYEAQDWYDMMPGFLAALAQMYFLNVLGSLYYRRLGEYRSNVFPHPEVVVDPPAARALRNLQSSLESAEATIVRRNKNRAWEYDYLLPSKIPASTNI